MHSVLVFWVVLLTASCVSKAPIPDQKPVPIDPALIAGFVANAIPCQSPVTAKPGLRKNFKYGCFCGIGHPDIAFSEADSLERRLERYYSVRPHDDVDQICRDHDVCWLLHGKGSGECNDELYDRLHEVAEIFEDSREFGDIDSISWRCEILAEDMASVFLTVLVNSKYNRPSATIGSWIGRAISSTFAWIIVVARAPVWAGEPYPLEGERCLI